MTVCLAAGCDKIPDHGIVLKPWKEDLPEGVLFTLLCVCLAQLDEDALCCKSSFAVVPRNVINEKWPEESKPCKTSIVHFVCCSPLEWHHNVGDDDEDGHNRVYTDENPCRAEQSDARAIPPFHKDFQGRVYLCTEGQMPQSLNGISLCPMDYSQLHLRVYIVSSLQGISPQTSQPESDRIFRLVAQSESVNGRRRIGIID